jgi:hypothetical protein
MKTDASTQQWKQTLPRPPCKRRRYCGNGDVMIGDFLGSCELGQRTSRGWTWFGALPIVGAGKWRINDVYAEVPLWCASEPIARRWSDLVCLEASWLQEWEWVLGRLPQEVLLEKFYRSWCSETVRVGRVRVFEELPTVFNCSVLTFWSAIKVHRE